MQGGANGSYNFMCNADITSHANIGGFTAHILSMTTDVSFFFDEVNRHTGLSEENGHSGTGDINEVDFINNTHNIQSDVYFLPA